MSHAAAAAAAVVDYSTAIAIQSTESVILCSESTIRHSFPIRNNHAQIPYHSLLIVKNIVNCTATDYAFFLFYEPNTVTFFSNSQLKRSQLTVKIVHKKKLF